MSQTSKEQPTIEEIDFQLKELNVAKVEPSAWCQSYHCHRSVGLMNEVFPTHVAKAL